MRNSQGYRDYSLLLRIRQRHTGGPSDPTISALLDGQLEASIKHAQAELGRAPRNGVRTWLRALLSERERRRRR